MRLLTGMVACYCAGTIFRTSAGVDDVSALENRRLATNHSDGYCHVAV